MKQKHKWTKGDVRLIIKLWATKTTPQIAEKLKVSEQSVTNVAGLLRQAGVKLPKKTINYTVNAIIKEMFGTKK